MPGYLRFLLLLGASVLTGEVLAAAPGKPNLVFILADDLGYGDLGCFGQREINTPHLDRMAAEGMRFTNAYAGSTVCAPSRAALMTGLHTGHTSVRGNRRPEMTSGYFLDAHDTTIATILKSAGYATAGIGKWGLGHPGREAGGLPERQGFDYFFGYLNQTHAHNSYPSHLYRNSNRVNLPNTVPGELPNGAGVSDNKLVFAEDLFIEEALQFIRAPRDQPFFLYFAPTLPHANNESKPFGLEIPNNGFSFNAASSFSSNPTNFLISTLKATTKAARSSTGTSSTRCGVSSRAAWAFFFMIATSAAVSPLLAGSATCLRTLRHASLMSSIASSSLVCSFFSFSSADVPFQENAMAARATPSARQINERRMKFMLISRSERIEPLGGRPTTTFSCFLEWYVPLPRRHQSTARKTSICPYHPAP